MLTKFVLPISLLFAIFITGFSLVKVVSSEDAPVPAKAIKCDRVCRTDCNTKIEATFMVQKDRTENYKGLLDVPERECYNFYDYEMEHCDEENEDETCCKTKLEQAEAHPACHNLIFDMSNQSLPEGSSIRKNCHLATTTSTGKHRKYFSNVVTDIKAEESDCITECYSRCQICWTEDNCEPICSEDKEFTIEGFNPQMTECSKPFYFCNRKLTKYQYLVHDGWTDEETRIQQFIVGTCTLDPALPIFITIAILLLFLLLAFIFRYQLKSCCNCTPLYRYE